MNIAFVMDALEGVKAYKDTTYYLMLAARQREHSVFYLDQHDLYLRHAAVYARVIEVDVHADVDRPFTQLHDESLCLESMDVVCIRTDPPFDRTYMYATLLLDLLPAKTWVVNRPSSLRNWNEKLAALEFPELSPPTLVSNHPDDIKEFAAGYERIVLKPLDGHGGQGIHFLERDANDTDAVIATATHDGAHWVEVQAYLPAANDGDKRILLLDGDPLGGILRVHADGVELNNLDAGGTAQPCELTEQDREICARLKPALQREGVVFCGIDVIGGRLIEINVTSPTGLQELCHFSGLDHHHTIIARLES